MTRPGPGAIMTERSPQKSERMRAMLDNLELVLEILGTVAFAASGAMIAAAGVILG